MTVVTKYTPICHVVYPTLCVGLKIVGVVLWNQGRAGSHNYESPFTSLTYVTFGSVSFTCLLVCI